MERSFMLNPEDENPTIEEPLLACLSAIRKRLIVIGSVARGKRWPKDLDLLWDFDNPRAKEEVNAAVKKHGLRFTSSFIGNWTFNDYGWMVELLPVSHGPDFRTIARRAGTLMISGIEFRVAQPEDAPKT